MLERVSLSEGALEAFKTLKKACITAPILAFADYTKPFLLETDMSKDGLGVVLSQKQLDGRYHPVAFGSRALMTHEKNYHSMKLEFLALKWVVTEHFKEYLPYQPFLVKTDNNPLTYIMMTPNLNATGHWWVGALVVFNFQLEYKKGCDNTVADVLSQVTTHLNTDTVRSILDGVTLAAMHQVEVHNPTVIKGDHGLEQEVCVTIGHVLVQMHITDWAKAQRKDPVLSEEGRLIWWNQQNFMIHQKVLYLHLMPKGKNQDLLLFVVPKWHWVTALNICHRDTGHQDHDHTLSLLQECIWWLGMTNQI